MTYDKDGNSYENAAMIHPEFLSTMSPLSLTLTDIVPKKDNVMSITATALKKINLLFRMLVSIHQCL